MTAQRVVILYQVFARIEVDDEGENYQWSIVQPSWNDVYLKVILPWPCQSTMSEPKLWDGLARLAQYICATALHVKGLSDF